MISVQDREAAAASTVAVPAVEPAIEKIPPGPVGMRYGQWG